VLGLAALLLLVENISPAGEPTGGPRPSLVAVLAARDAPVRRLLWIAGTLSLVTVSDGFVYLILREQGGVSGDRVPLLFSATAACYLLGAAPAGYLADRLGYRRIFLAGQLLLLAAYATPFMPVGGWSRALACVLALGGYYATTDGVLAAWTSAVLPAAIRSTGLAILASVTSVARLFGSAAFGVLWASQSSFVAAASFGAALLMATLAASRWLPTSEAVTVSNGSPRV
jgi:MFS family permease